VERVYGSPGNDLPSEGGAMMSMECVGPSAVDESNKIKGGVVIAKLKRLTSEPIPSDTVLNCRYYMRVGWDKRMRRVDGG
jgi:hypothetical protein